MHCHVAGTCSGFCYIPEDARPLTACCIRCTSLASIWLLSSWSTFHFFFTAAGDLAADGAADSVAFSPDRTRLHTRVGAAAKISDTARAAKRLVLRMCRLCTPTCGSSGQSGGPGGTKIGRNGRRSGCAAADGSHKPTVCSRAWRSLCSLQPHGNGMLPVKLNCMSSSL